MLPVIICFSNFGYKDFADNFMCNIIHKIKNHKVVYYCLDDQIYTYLTERYSNIDNISIERYENTADESITEFANFGTQEFAKITDVKLKLIKDALMKYEFIHVVDADIVFVQEPDLDYHKKYELYDIVYQNDMPYGQKSEFSIWTCTGNWTLRNTEATRRFLDNIAEFKNKNPSIDEQTAQRLLFVSKEITDIREYPYAKLYEFPVSEFVCGYYITNNFIDINRALVVHANHVVGKENKINLLRKIGYWYDTTTRTPCEAQYALPPVPVPTISQHTESSSAQTPSGLRMFRNGRYSRRN